MESQFPFQIDSLKNVSQTFIQLFDELKASHSKRFFSQQISLDLKLCFVEAVANAIKHAQELKNKKSVKGYLFFDEKKVGFKIIDHGQGFDLDSIPIPDFSKLTSSGRGIFMMKQLSDHLSYVKQDDHNELVLWRSLIGSKDTPELDLLYELSEAILGRIQIEQIYEIILNHALDLFKVKRASILVYDAKIKKLKVVASRGIQSSLKQKILVRPGEGFSGFVFQHGKPMLITDIEKNPQGIPKKKRYKSRSFISAPMISSPLRPDEKPWGVINLTDRVDGKDFTKKDLKLLSTIANQATACIYINSLLQKSQQAERLKQEIKTLCEIQMSYLPTQPPAIQKMDLAGHCEMADSVGGDYYDYILKDNDLYIVIADVSGHDIKSATTMMNFRAQLHMLLNLKKDPAQILKKLNESLLDDLESACQFVSCLLIRIDIKTGKFVFSNAGHYPPIFYKPKKSIEKSSLVLGIEKKERFYNIEGRLKKGEGFVLFTDGMIEAMNQKHQLYGMGRLQKLIQKHHKESSQKLVSRLIHSVLKFRSSQTPLDDLTVVAIRYI